MYKKCLPCAKMTQNYHLKMGSLSGKLHFKENNKNFSYVNV